MVKIEGKPRGRICAYAYFVQTCRKEDKKNNPDENVVFGDFSRKCSALWRSMDNNNKGPFNVLAEEDKKRYEREMADYKPPKGEKGGKKRKRTKDPNAPKRAISAFFWFCSDERPAVRRRMADANVGEVAKVLGRQWKACTEEQKSKYERLAAKDKARYKEEVEAYKARRDNGNNVKKEEYQDEDDEDEEDEEEDEDDED